ncbi:MAG: hypothetical protein E7161_04430 [Firmicutes bacterium]|nr:hypothetical protein [Bacillota bacterium]
MKDKILTKLKSKVFWIELVLLIAYILRLFEIYDMPNDTITLIQDIITAIFTIFATMNNPDTREEF